MRRHPALHPLSRDHHDVLMHARRLQREDARVDAAQAVDRFLRYHDAVLVHHFHEEEEGLLPSLPADLASRVVAQHNDLRQRAAALADGGDAVALGQALRAHVRFEEDVVFQHLQQAVDDPRWESLGQALATLRGRLRPQAGHGEDCFL